MKKSEIKEKKPKKSYLDGRLRSEYWTKYNYYHREDGPAVILYHENGNIECEEWWYYGKPHRKNGPAITYYYENGNVKAERWYQRGHGVHREDGPAYIVYDEDGNIIKKEYEIDGKKINELQQAVINATK